jgi:hypothetical protein
MEWYFVRIPIVKHHSRRSQYVRCASLQQTTGGECEHGGEFEGITEWRKVVDSFELGVRGEGEDGGYDGEGVGNVGRLEHVAEEDRG